MFLHDGFEGRTDIVTSHAKQDRKIQSISYGLYYIYSNDENSFILTKKQYQFLNTLAGNVLNISPKCREETYILSIYT